MGVIILIRLLALLLLPALAFAEPEEMPSGCFTSFKDAQCVEDWPIVWIDYGKSLNAHMYGAPVAALLNQAVSDRRLLLEWIEWGKRKARAVKTLKRQLQTRNK